MDKEILQKLKSQSTWRLLFLGIITFGVYWAHYIYGQTKIINKHISDRDAIPESFAVAIIVISYVSLTMMVPYVLVDKGHPVERFTDLIDFIWAIGLLVWGFKARNRLNATLSLNKNQNEWFSGLWTFLFTPLYFNFKVNKLNQELMQNRNIAPE